MKASFKRISYGIGSKVSVLIIASNILPACNGRYLWLGTAVVIEIGQLLQQLISKYFDEICLKNFRDVYPINIEF